MLKIEDVPIVEGKYIKVPQNALIADIHTEEIMWTASQSAGKADAGTVEDLCLLEQANAMTAEQMSKDLLPVQPTAR